MRVAIVTESFYPQVNGVTNSVARVVEHLSARGHEALVLAPGPGPTEHAGTTVVRVPSVVLPWYRSFALGRPSRQLEAELTAFAPDVVHLASPIALGAQGAVLASRLDVPAVAVYQTDIVRFAARYHLAAARHVLWAWLRHVHGGCARTLAPSSHALMDLRRNGIERVALWGRGIDARLFAPERRDAALRDRLAPHGEVLVGYVGRVAAEKRVERLVPLDAQPGSRVVVVGDGPQRAALQRRMPGAAFLGFLQGAELAAAVASLDLFVHPGTDETFCQAAQEALSSGLPVVAPASGGLVDLVRDGETGLLCPPGDPEALGRAVRALVRDGSRRAEMGGRTHASVAGRSWEVLGDQLLGHYRAVLQGTASEEAVA